MTGISARPWLVGMNPEQAAVIAWGEGPCLVTAGAGSGKTRALVNRVARLVREQAVMPERVLAVTFTSKAADEMKKRLRTELGVGDVRVCTWHSLCLGILRDDETRWASYEIDDKNRYRTVLKEVCGYKHLDWKGCDVTVVDRFVTHCKANLIAPDSPEALPLAKTMFKKGAREAALGVRAYALAEVIADERGMLTFDDFLVRVVEHFRENEDRREAWAERFDYVLQDEAQDANRAQVVIGEMLARDHRNYMVIGDPAQSIYGFRGSSPSYLMEFPEVWGAETICLNRNYRSGDCIVSAANSVVEAGTVKMSAPLIGERGVAGRIEFRATENFDDEASNFVEWCKAHQADGLPYGNITCLFRTNAQSRALEEALLNEKIPYMVVGAESFYDRKEVKDLLAYVRVALGRDGEGDAVRRCVNAPFRFLGAKFVEKVMEIAASEREPWVDVVEQAAQQTGIQARQKSSAAEWCRIIDTIAKQDGETLPATEEGGEPTRKHTAGDIVKWLVHETKYIDWLTKEEGEESVENSRASNVRELMRVAGRFASLDELLTYIERNIAESKRERRKQGSNRVLLMSIHRSKGLEWPRVWVVGCNEGILPHARGDQEEERRLTYVAMTRAKDELVLSYVTEYTTPRGVMKGVPSPFLIGAGVLPKGEGEGE
jgi:DNA helicase II / ATP-dependent DNA helicase PcrA